jgi:quercetin dioxygenase-like cupin family protein
MRIECDAPRDRARSPTQDAVNPPYGDSAAGTRYSHHRDFAGNSPMQSQGDAVMTRLPLTLPIAAIITLVGAQTDAQRGTPQGPGYHLVTVPTNAGPGEGKEAKTVLETPHLKLATVVLRRGTVLEEHSSPTPVTIQVISGRGTIELGEASERVGPGSLLSLSPGRKHLVRPEAGGDMVLLVHHLKAPRVGRARAGAP